LQLKTDNLRLKDANTAYLSRAKNLARNSIISSIISWMMNFYTILWKSA